MSNFAVLVNYAAFVAEDYIILELWEVLAFCPFSSYFWERGPVGPSILYSYDCESKSYLVWIQIEVFAQILLLKSG